MLRRGKVHTAEVVGILDFVDFHPSNPYTG
jgi:hypothetical protein